MEILTGPWHGARVMKTTALGVLIILGSIINAVVSFLKVGSIDLETTSTGVLSGWGLIHAADSKKSDGGNLQCNPLATICACLLALAVVCGFTSCTVTTAPDGTTTKAVDEQAVEQGASLVERFYSLFKSSEAPVVTPTK